MAETTHRFHNFLSIILHEERLYGVSIQSGELYPLYVYGPLQEALDASRHGEAPPLIDNWPEYARQFVSQYVPLPIILTNIGDVIAEHLPEFSLPAELLSLLPKILLPEAIRSDISFQYRSDGRYPWPQSTFRLWPLYYVSPGFFTDEHLDRPVMFRPATLALAELSQPDNLINSGKEAAAEGGGVTFPPPAIGP